MKPERLNAFTDGVLAIVITIMVLELHVPEGPGFEALMPSLPLLGAYLLAFVNIGLFWNNHHHMMQAARKVDGRVLWANMAVLFALSLVPFVIRWIGEAGFASEPVAAYGAVLVLASLAWTFMERALIAAEGERSVVARAVGPRLKEWLSSGLYLVAIAVAFVSPWIAIAIYIFVAAAWFIPDRRFERRLQASPPPPKSPAKKERAGR
jgi:TMEM175 potassium channel family protein